MKKIISFFIVIVMISVIIIAAIPASAAGNTYAPNWLQLKNDTKYIAYDGNGNVISFTNNYHNYLTMTREENLLSAKRKANGGSASYISQIQFKITSRTIYEYEVDVKSNSQNRYGGVPFAIDGNNRVYFAYGSFDNSNDTNLSQKEKSYIITARGDFDKKFPTPNDEKNDLSYFKELSILDGFSSLKFVYKGYTVKVMAKTTSGSYEQVGYDVTLPSGSYLCFGVFSRDADNMQNRTVSIKNAVITGINSDALSCMRDAGVDVDVNAGEDAPEPEEPGVFDSTELEELIDKAYELNEDHYNKISYNMLMNVVENAEELIWSDTATQSEIDEAAAQIRVRMSELKLLDGVEPDGDLDGDTDGDTDADDDTDRATEVVETEPVAETKETSDAILNMKQSCTSAVGSTAAVVALVSTLGTALVIKKKD